MKGNDRKKEKKKEKSDKSNKVLTDYQREKGSKQSEGLIIKPKQQ